MVGTEIVAIDWNEFKKSGDDHESLGGTGEGIYCIENVDFAL